MEFPIDGLHWKDRYYQDNGGESYVVPYPTTRPVHIVFHGTKTFNHGHLGYHSGIEDRLTFLGSSSSRITGHFADCRRGSLTQGTRFRHEFRPSSRRTLIIPPGVAHSFDGLENIHTINDFMMYLPHPSKLMTNENPWVTGADITNFPFDASDSEIPYVEPNTFPASEAFYDLLREFQLKTLDSVDYEYPSTEKVLFSDGSAYNLQVKKKVEHFAQIPEWDPLPEIPGVGWRRHYVVWGDSSAGYSALLDPAPFQVIDHGEKTYENDAYGIHLQSEDRLTFLGDPAQRACVRLLDCREDSPAFDKELDVEFHPSALRYLCIPPGVAHGFKGLENIYTVNRARRCAGNLTQYEPGNDVIDWHFSDRPAPAFLVKETDVPLSYYKELARRQQAFIEKNVQDSTAMVFMAKNNDGEQVRVALRKRTSH